jgi:hypothetical protein
MELRCTQLQTDRRRRMSTPQRIQLRTSDTNDRPQSAQPPQGNTMNQYGPGPVIHGQDVNNPDRFIVQENGGPPQLLTPNEIAQLPIRPQWFTGTANGLLCTWPTRDIAETRVAQMGVILGQIICWEGALTRPAAVLCDPMGRPLRCET